MAAQLSGAAAVCTSDDSTAATSSTRPKVEDLTTQELSMLLLTKLTDSAQIWGASREELQECAAENGITVLSDEDIREVWPLGKPSESANAETERRVKDFEAQLTERYERARIARETARVALPSKVLIGQLMLVFVLTWSRQRYGSVAAAKEATLQWLGWVPAAPPPPCPSPTWLQRATPWLKNGESRECNS